MNVALIHSISDEGVVWLGEAKIIGSCVTPPSDITVARRGLLTGVDEDTPAFIDEDHCVYALVEILAAAPRLVYGCEVHAIAAEDWPKLKGEYYGEDAVTKVTIDWLRAETGRKKVVVKRPVVILMSIDEDIEVEVGPGTTAFEVLTERMNTAFTSVIPAENRQKVSVRVISEGS